MNNADTTVAVLTSDGKVQKDAGWHLYARRRSNRLGAAGGDDR